MKRWILNKILAHLFNAVTTDDILKYEAQTLTLNGQPVTNRMVDELRSGAETLKSMYVFQLLMKEMKHAANQRMYQHSKSDADIVFGKAMLYSIDVLEKKIINLSQLK